MKSKHQGQQPKSESDNKVSGPRQLAMDILTRIEQQQSYSNLLLNQSLRQTQLSERDRALATELVYGTLTRLNTIDYLLERFVIKGIRKLEPWVRNLLRLSLYQLQYLDRIPDRAVVHEAVSIAKRRGHQGIGGMVNGVLRNIIRQPEQLQLPDDLTPVTRISLEHSHPEWLVKKWIGQFGEATTEAICKANNLPPHLSVRNNRMKQDVDSLERLILERGIKTRRSSLSDQGLIVEYNGNIAHTEWYANGQMTIQDESSMLVAALLAPLPGMNVLDACAAPGGKSTHLAELMRDQGTVLAVDQHEHKRKLIEEHANRLQLSSIRTLTCDARQLDQQLPLASFDRVLLDAPCSGLGIVRRKPDIKWAKYEAELASLVELQTALLRSASRLVRPGGVLVYSTYTMQEEENERMVKRFLEEHPEFQADPNIAQYLPDTLHAKINRDGMIQIMPHEFHSDGFFMARLLKRES